MLHRRTTLPSPKTPRLLAVSALLLAVAASSAPSAAAEPDWAERLRYRMLLVRGTPLDADSQLEAAKQQLRSAAITGYNTVVLEPSANLVQPQRAGKEYLARLAAFAEEARRIGLAIIPGVMPFDAPNLVLPFDPHLAEGLPVRDVLYVVKGNAAHFQPEQPIEPVNPSFEIAGPNGIPGWQAASLAPGRSIAIDTSQARYGNSSLCLENAAERKPNLAYRAIQKLRLPAFRLLRARVWLKPNAPQDAARVFVTIRNAAGSLAFRHAPAAQSADWQPIELVFNTLEGGRSELWLALYDSQSQAHKVWFDELTIEDLGVCRPIRRPGCPIVVRNERGRAYDQGRDFQPIDEQLAWRPGEGLAGDCQPLPLRLTRKTRIRPGERLRIDYYSPVYLPCDRTSVCINSDRAYDFFAAGTAALQPVLSPLGYLLATRYIGTANWDAACRATRKPPGAQWGDSLRRQLEILASPGRPPLVFAWSDMYEPWTNPHRQFHVSNGSFEDACRFLPKDVILVNANHAADDGKSPRFFAAAGYRQVIAGGAALGEWLRANAEMPGIVGVINTDAPLDTFAASAWGSPK